MPYTDREIASGWKYNWLKDIVSNSGDSSVDSGSQTKRTGKAYPVVYCTNREKHLSP